MTPLLFVPGMMCDGRLFRHQIDHFSGERSVTVGALVRFDTINGLATEILVHAPPRFALCGLSMGGIVAMEIMRIAPNRVERLALMDTNHLADHPDNKQMRIEHIEKVKAGKLRQIIRDELKPRYLADGPNRKATLDLCMEMALGLGDSVFIDQSRALMARDDQTETLKRIDRPTTIICGAEDGLCPVLRHEQMADLIADSRLEIVEGAGHLPPLETPEITNRLLESWLRQ